MNPKIKLLFIFFIFLTSCTSTNNSNEKIKVSYIIEGNKSAKAGQFERAKKEYELALKADPNSQTAKRNLGIVLVKLASFKESVEYLKEILPNYSKDAEVHYFLGESYRGLGLYSDALSSYIKGLSISAKDERIIKSIAWVYLKQNKPIEAKNIIQKYYNQDKEDIQLMLIMSNISLKLKDYNKTIQILKYFESSNYKLKSSNKELAETEKILLLDTLGEAYLELGICDKSNKIYDIILQARPYLASALLKSAKCDLKMSRYQEAEVKLEKAQAADPDNPDILFWLGVVYAPIDPKKSTFYYQRFLDRSENNQTLSAETSRAQSAVRAK